MVPEALHRFVLGLEPGDEPPHGYQDYLAEVRQYSDSAPAYGMIRQTDAASPDGTSYAEWGEVAHGIASLLDLRAGDRLLVDAAEHEEPVKWLLAPLSAGASVVLCANLDRSTLDTRIAAEGVTRVL